MIAFFLSAYYNSILVYSWSYFFRSFESPLPWTVAHNASDILNEGYFNNQVLHRTASVEILGGFQPGLFCLYIFSIVLCTLAIVKGVKVSGKITLVTASLPYLLLAVLLVRGLFLEGAGDALQYLLTPQLSKLLRPGIWKDACVQVFFQLSVGTGVPIMFSSFRERRAPIGRFTWLFCAGVGLCGLLSVVIVYIYMFHFARLHGLQFEEVVVSGPSLAFVVFSQALALLPWPNLWSGLFYFTLILLGIDSEFGFMETVAASVEDAIPDFKKWADPIAVRKVMGAILCCCSVLFSFGNGYHMVMLVDSFTCNLPIPLICLAEAYLIGHRLDYMALEAKQQQLTGAGSDRLLLREITGLRVTYALLVILAIGLFEQLAYAWTLNFVLNLLGWSITLSPVLLTLLFLKRGGSTLSIDELDIRNIYTKPRPLELEMY
ncbi:sodium-dependent neutral amino acid transporter B(0)AT1-like [Hippocampus zosterae]|uniref:sodium-dependent neutral amino acid transporter B(0)AT1-like n=1 Tax=Hippocampus zosterae TaxID=109293 RepID=UPI00223E1919|nr:sodium-dependent neutral amino acid transporter B(0)AT1-like [Hippocampus zosterae]